MVPLVRPARKTEVRFSRRALRPSWPPLLRSAYAASAAFTPSKLRSRARVRRGQNSASRA
jgi:hypothetical protein